LGADRAALFGQRRAGDASQQTFYATLLRPERPATLAEAVWRARTAIRQPNDPTWLAYSLFARPNATVAL
jgi:hypothetical protein